MNERDAAYHNGTAWPWLLGAYCEALVRVGDAKGVEEGAAARVTARRVIAPLLDNMWGPCLGQVAEVYDGAPPQTAQGCPAQAWSVAEIIRVLCL
mmetsp:Transcript_35808/g.113191  ORF Transcript_35808/g.113191 Transcript_35808/m.113191 type:complete len:95 (+) Transcript_35808:118-402(+)|eukprot:CAMPEP_0182852382 /NCGR_PEP_ID=MMETSP0034_2-20130328/133_1 /TAXON_ID=156128 /ORGANISM="Nephroselmis pyriformis, Strain CCMP717" /LENGTH=94 /DNA_ID=CAMNT_0024983087 /DNA_START=220 /DNA_END=504 /DNA_ORIENTATION=-